MVRNMVILGGSSHPALTECICNTLGIPPGAATLTKFSVGETRVEIEESVRGKDVYIIQSGGGRVNDHLMELLITISACKTASAKKVTAVLPLFPYSRQSDLPYNKVGAPLARNPVRVDSSGVSQSGYSFESRPQSPKPGTSSAEGSNGNESLHKQVARVQVQDTNFTSMGATEAIHKQSRPKRNEAAIVARQQQQQQEPQLNGVSPHAATVSNVIASTSPNIAPTPVRSSPGSAQPPPPFSPQRGYRHWVAQAGTLVADLLTCAGADHIITMDLHDQQYQGFFDIPVDNLYARHLLRRYIERQIPNFRDAVIVSPDAGGAKRATAIADGLGMPFALIHKERRPASSTSAPIPNSSTTTSTSTSSRDHSTTSSTTYQVPSSGETRQAASMILVGSVSNRTAILIDDLADTCNTITRAAKMLKREGATTIYALVTHGVLSGDAIERINASALDKVVVTNSVRQEEHVEACAKLEVLEVGGVFAEAIRRVHFGESISVLFEHD